MIPPSCDWCAVNEVSAALEKIEAALEHCVPLAQRLNGLLPEDSRLEHFRLRARVVEEEEEEESVVSDSHLGVAEEEERTWPRS